MVRISPAHFERTSPSLGRQETRLSVLLLFTNGQVADARRTATCVDPSEVLILLRPSGRRSCFNVNFELRSSAAARRSSAVRFLTRRGAPGFFGSSSDVFPFVTSGVPPLCCVLPNHPRAVERGTPTWSDLSGPLDPNAWMGY